MTPEKSEEKPIDVPKKVQWPDMVMRGFAWGIKRYFIELLRNRNASIEIKKCRGTQIQLVFSDEVGIEAKNWVNENSSHALDQPEGEKKEVLIWTFPFT